MSHFIDQIVDRNRCTNCSRRPIFKAADEFLHHYTCLVQLKERKRNGRLTKYFALMQPVQALVHCDFACRYRVSFTVNAKLFVFQSMYPTVTTNLAVNALLKSHEGAFPKQQIAENLRMPCSA